MFNDGELGGFNVFNTLSHLLRLLQYWNFVFISSVVLKRIAFSHLYIKPSISRSICVTIKATRLQKISMSRKVSLQRKTFSSMNIKSFITTLHFKFSLWLFFFLPIFIGKPLRVTLGYVLTRRRLLRRFSFQGQKPGRKSEKCGRNLFQFSGERKEEFADLRCIIFLSGAKMFIWENSFIFTLSIINLTSFHNPASKQYPIKGAVRVSGCLRRGSLLTIFSARCKYFDHAKGFYFDSSVNFPLRLSEFASSVAIFFRRKNRSAAASAVWARFCLLCSHRNRGALFANPGLESHSVLGTHERFQS